MTWNDGSEPFEPGDTFSSEEVISRIAYLSDMRDTYGENTEEFTADDAEELAKLEALAEEAKGYIPDWEYGETFISEDYFEDYARELADDIGAINTEAGWPNQYIDWEAAADALKLDYTEFEWKGTTYYAR